MECEKIRNHLSEYMDGILDAETMSLIQEHVSSCKDCEQELDSLQTLVQELGNMEQKKAPDNFLEQIHARKAKRFDVNEWFRAMLMPFRVRIPYRFATVAAMALLIFFIIHTPELEKEMPPTHLPGERHKSAEVTDHDGSLGLQRAKEAQPPAPKKIQPRAHDREEQTVTSPEKITSPKVALKRKIAPAKPEFNKPSSIGGALTIKAEKKFTSGNALKSIEIVLLMKPDVSTHDEIPEESSYTTDAVSAPEKGLSQRLRASGSGKAAPMPSSHMIRKDSLEEEPSGSPAEETMKQKKAPASGDLSRDNVHSSITALINSINGSILSTEYDEKTGRPKFVNAEIPAEQYGIFRKKLLQFGTLQSPTPVIVAKGTDPISIYIRLIHP